MITYFQNRQFRRACAAMLLFGSMAGGLRADSILFTPPAVPLEAPPKPEDALPTARPDQLNFVAPSQGVAIAPRQQMFQRQQPREFDPDDEEMKHPLLRDPKKMPDPLSKLVPKSPTEKWLDKLEARKKEEKKDSLSPVTTFEWREDLRNREGLGRKDSLAEHRGTWKKEREDERDSNPFRLGKDQDKQKERERDRNNFQGAGLNAPQLLDQREKSMLADMERRATAFDELLNPRQAVAAPSAKQRSSLEPVAGFDAPQPAQPATTPPVGQQVVRAPIDPTKSFEERQQRRLQSSVMDDLNAKYGPQTKSSSSKPTTEPAFSTPLLRQPLTRDFPTRSF